MTGLVVLAMCQCGHTNIRHNGFYGACDVGVVAPKGKRPSAPACGCVTFQRDEAVR